MIESPAVKPARDLTEIINLTAALHEQAIARANDRDYLPGGNAMVSLAPVGNIEAWETQFETRERLGRDHSHVEDEDDTWEPPLQTIRFWTDQYRRFHEAERDHTPTIHSEVGFLRQLLNWAHENDPRWDHLTADINKVRRRLEDMLYDGVRAERTRVPCTNEACTRKPRLIRVYGNTAAEDHYKCTAADCKAKYTQQEFARAKLRHLESEGAGRHVLMQDARDAIDRPRRTWDKWIRYWYVRSYRDARTGQVWVWWPDVREVDQSTPRRERKIA